MFYRNEHSKSTFVKLVAGVALAVLFLCAGANAAAASVRRDSFLSQLLAARGFATQTNARRNAAFILKNGIVTDQVDNLASPVTRREALRWAIQALGLSAVANILSDVHFEAVGLNFNDTASLTPFERGSLIVATRMRPPIFRSDAGSFRPARNLSQNDCSLGL